MKANEVMKKYNITRVTLCNWVRLGKIHTTKTPSGRYDYHFKTDLPNNNRKNVIYGRVSTTNQKENLDRQIERLRTFSINNGMIINEIYSDIGSGLDYNRKNYKRLLSEVISGEIDTIIIEYKDRLLRIGFEDFEFICDKFNTKIIVLDETLYDPDKSKYKEITEDLISIIHHFSMKIYSSRKRKKIEETINWVEND